MKYDVIDIDSEIFLQIKNYMINDNNEDLVYDLESDIANLIEVLNNANDELSKFENKDYKERISVI